MTNEKEIPSQVRRRFYRYPGGMRRNELTSKLENAVPAGLLLGPRFRLGLPISNWPLAICVAMRAARFPFDFVFELSCCATGKEMSEGVGGSAF